MLKNDKSCALQVVTKWKSTRFSGHISNTDKSEMRTRFLTYNVMLVKYWESYRYNVDIEDVRYERFEVFTAVTMKNGVFWDVTPCSSCKNQRFGRT
jgi:hypothetical protein